MKILGKIENRTENWKTAQAFAPYYGSKALLLAQRLAKPLGQTVKMAHLELFWNGMRDFIACQKKRNGKSSAQLESEVGSIYSCHFSTLREKISKFEGFRKWDKEGKNYSADEVEGIYNNLVHTEIDIVIETEQFMFIGEAKGVTQLHSSSNHILVHQLIRQYVMATVLKDLCKSYKDIVPFVVGVDGNQDQVKFMIEEKWLKEQNVLGWEHIENPMELFLVPSDS